MKTSKWVESESSGDRYSVVTPTHEMLGMSDHWIYLHHAEMSVALGLPEEAPLVVWTKTPLRGEPGRFFIEADLQRPTIVLSEKEAVRWSDQSGAPLYDIISTTLAHEYAHWFFQSILVDLDSSEEEGLAEEFAWAWERNLSAKKAATTVLRRWLSPTKRTKQGDP
jgi:hypothetical protein